MKNTRSINVYKRLIKLSIGSSISALLLISQPSFAATLKHVVNPGETLSQLAVRYKVSQTQIIDANGLSASHLQIGQVLNIPDTSKPTIYKVKPGDSLYSVAHRYNITTTELARINNIPTNARLDIADTLVLPSNAQVNLTTPTSTNDVESSDNEVSNVNTTRNVTPGTTGKHRVLQGETLTKIANDYDVSLSSLAQANNISTREMIRYGQLLIIPSTNTATARAKKVASTKKSNQERPSTYTVKPGEGLIVIARKFNVNFMDLAAENNLEGYESLRVGQKLKIPAAD